MSLQLKNKFFITQRRRATDKGLHIQVQKPDSMTNNIQYEIRSVRSVTNIRSTLYCRKYQSCSCIQDHFFIESDHLPSYLEKSATPEGSPSQKVEVVLQAPLVLAFFCLHRSPHHRHQHRLHLHRLIREALPEAVSVQQARLRLRDTD